MINFYFLRQIKLLLLWYLLLPAAAGKYVHIDIGEEMDVVPIRPK